MLLEGSYTFTVPVEAVWDALMDPTVLASALPGGEEIVQVGENEYTATMNVRIGPVQGRFEGCIELADIKPLQSYRMKVNGQGAPGFVSGEGSLQLSPHSDGGSLLEYKGDVQVGGKIAGVSQRLVESSARSLTRQGLQALEAQIGARMNPSVESSAPSGAEEPAVSGAVVTPGATENGTWQPIPTRRTVAPQPPPLSPLGVALTTTRDVARDLASDYLPIQQQERLFWVVVGALGMLVFSMLVRAVQKR
jgi:carbon monoxide dehydrogenase subunit G